MGRSRSWWLLSTAQPAAGGATVTTPARDKPSPSARRLLPPLRPSTSAPPPTPSSPCARSSFWVDGHKIEQQDHTWNGSAWFNYTAGFSPGAHKGLLRSRHRQRPAATPLRLHRRPWSVRGAILAGRQLLHAGRLLHNVSSPRRGRRQHLRHSCPHGTLG